MAAVAHHQRAALPKPDEHHRPRVVERHRQHQQRHHRRPRLPARLVVCERRGAHREHEAEEVGPRTAGEDLRGREVPDKEPRRRAPKRQQEQRHEPLPRRQRPGHQQPRSHQSHPPAQPVHRVQQVERVGDHHDPRHGEHAPRNRAGAEHRDPKLRRGKEHAECHRHLPRQPQARRQVPVVVGQPQPHDRRAPQQQRPQFLSPRHHQRRLDAHELGHPRRCPARRHQPRRQVAARHGQQRAQPDAQAAALLRRLRVDAPLPGLRHQAQPRRQPLLRRQHHHQRRDERNDERGQGRQSQRPLSFLHSINEPDGM